MKKRSLLMIAVIVGMATLFLTAGIYAGTEVTDDIMMDNKAYKEHKKSIVNFTHKKHADEYAKKYPEFYANGCGECHHNDKNEPLKDLKAGDDVQNCVACHKDTTRPKGLAKLPMKEKMKYHSEAIHENCKGCHEKVNKKAGKGTAPKSCTKCHPKKKK